MRWGRLLALGVLLIGLAFTGRNARWPVAHAQVGSNCSAAQVSLDNTLVRQTYYTGGLDVTVSNCEAISVNGNPGFARLTVHFGSNVSLDQFNLWENNVNSAIGYPHAQATMCAIGSNTPDPYQPLPQTWNCTSSYTGTSAFPTHSDLSAWVNLSDQMTVHFTASPTQISPGGSSTLGWTSTGVHQITIDQGIGSVAAPNGSRSVTNIQQTTLYTLTATGYIGSKTATATVSIALPDLQVNLDNVEALNNLIAGPQAKLYDGVGDIGLRNIVVTNTGSGDAPAGVTVLLSFAGSNIEIEGYRLLTATVSSPIPAHSQVTLPTVYLPAARIALFNKGGLFALSDDATSGLKAMADPDNRVTESNENNNTTTKDNFFMWPVLRLTLTVDQTAPAQGAVVRLKSPSKEYVGLTDPTGDVRFGLLEKPITNYTVSIDYQGEGNIAGGTASIDEYRFFQQDVAFSSAPALGIRPITLVPDELNPHGEMVDFFDQRTGEESTTSRAIIQGFVAVKTAAGAVIKQPIVAGIARFNNLPAGVTQVQPVEVEADISYQFQFVQGIVHYHWLSGNGDQGQSLPNDQQIHDLKVSLTTDCSTQATAAIKVCVYDESSQIDQAKQTWLPIVAKQLARLANFSPSVRLTSVPEVWAVAPDNDPGHFDPRNPAPIWIFSRTAAANSQLAADVTVHESMHAIDRQLGGSGNLSGDKAYAASYKLNAEGGDGLEVTTGESLWQLAGRTCAYFSAGNNCFGHSFDDGAEEIFAEQMTNACLFPQAVTSRLTNIEAYYRQNNLAVPADLARQRDILLSRGVHPNPTQNGDVIYAYLNTSPQIKHYDQIAALISECVRTAQ